MAAIDEWARKLRPEDLTVDGLARLEAELFRAYPKVQSSIENIVDRFASVAQPIERRHHGRQLMAPVVARRNRDWRASRNPLLAFVSFLIVTLPACAWAITLRGSGEYESIVWTVAGLVAITAGLCVVKLLSTLRDPVWVGVMLHWAVAAGVLSASTMIVSLIVSVVVASRVSGHHAGIPLVILSISALIVVGYAALALVRRSRTARALKADLTQVQPAVDSYLGEIMPEYEQALAQIKNVVKTIDVAGTVDPKAHNRLRNQRNGVLAVLAGKGLYQGQVPLHMNKRAVGEFQLYAVIEPLLGGGPHPALGRGRRHAPTGNKLELDSF